MFKDLKHVFLDMDGTIYHGTTLFPTTIPFLNYLKDHNIGYTFLSNNSSYSTADYVAKLAKIGITAAPEEFYISTDYAIDYLKAMSPAPQRIYYMGMDSVWESFKKAGFIFDDDQPEAVIIAFDRTLTYDKLCRAAWHLYNNVPGIATHPDVFCPTDQATWLPDCGSFIACLETATGKKIQVLGKPDPGMLIAAAKRNNCLPEQCLMVGDRLGTDIKLGVNAGAQTAWIENTTAELTRVQGVDPTYTIKDLGELQQLIAKEID